MGELKRTLNLPEVVFFATGVILGAGIYTVIGKAAGSAGNMLWLSFSISALTALLSLFSYAELISMYPSSGGEFSFVKKIINTRWAYAVGCLVALSGIVSAATISLGFSGYLSGLVEFPGHLTAIGIIVLIFIINVLGIKHSSLVNIVFTILETCGLLFVIYSAAPSLGEVNYLESPPMGINGILAGAAICFFAFTGFEDAVKLAEETKNPEKNIPRGLFISSAIISTIYLCVACVIVSMVPFKELANSENPLSLVVEKRFGHTGAVIIAVVALFSTSNSLLSNMLGASRVIYSMGKTNQKLSLFAKVLPQRKTPWIALIMAAAASCAFSLIGDVKQVALITTFIAFLIFFVINCSLIYSRLKDKTIKRPFKIPGSIGNVPIIPVFAIAMILVLICYTAYSLITG
ncbi:MAG: amino acid permease [Bacteroidota bacterium]